MLGTRVSGEDPLTPRFQLDRAGAFLSITLTPPPPRPYTLLLPTYMFDEERWSRTKYISPQEIESTLYSLSLSPTTP